MYTRCNKMNKVKHMRTIHNYGAFGGPSVTSLSHRLCICIWICIDIRILSWFRSHDYSKKVSLVMQAALFCINHVQVTMVLANLLRLLILFLAVSKEKTEDASENNTIIVLESCFHCICLAAMWNHCSTLHLAEPESVHLPKCPVKLWLPRCSNVAR